MNDRKSGFTLVEMLVALFVFSIVTIAAISIMRVSLMSKESVSEAASKLRDLQIARSLLKSDFGQLAARPARNTFGAFEPSIVGGRDAPEGTLIAFTRNGWTNPGAGAPRASLQRVEYSFDAGALVRRVRPHLDAGRGAGAQETILVNGLDGVRIDYRVGEDWLQNWRAGAEADFPPVIRATFSFARDGDVEMLFMTPRGI